MKKLLMIAVVTFASASAFATKARLNSLSYPMSRQLTDVQTVFVNPSDLTLMGSWATFEMGNSNLAGTVAMTTPNAEAGFARAVGDARWGFYMGHSNAGILVDTFARGAALRPTGLLIEENPINLFYAAKMADIAWGLGLNYANTDRKAAGKQNSTGVTLGMRMGFWDASLDVDAADKAENATLSWEGKTGADLRVGYVMDTMYFYGQYTMAGGKSTTVATGATATDVENSRIALGVVNTAKSEGGEFFYGAALAMTNTNEKVAAGKTESLALPVVIGIEADAASWLVLRGSITQTVLLNSVKTTPVSGTSTDATGGNNTRVAAGTGIKFNKFVLDTTLAAESNGNINGANLLANAGLVYNF